MVTKRDAVREVVRLLPAVAVNLRLGALMDLQGVQGVDLTANQLIALELVALAPEGRMKAGEIAGRLGISSPAATALVDRLVAAGVVTRSHGEESHGEDRRVVWVSLTEVGRGLVARLAAGLENVIEAALETGYDPATLDGLVDGMRRVADFADRIGEPHARSYARGHPKNDDGRPSS